MARLFVTSDNLAVRIELMRDDEMDGEGNYIDSPWIAICVGCVTGRGLDADNLLRDERARFNLEDAIEEIVSPHADHCTRCADPDCRTDGRHDAGHRCRKD